VSRFTANGNVAVPGSELAILDLETLSSATNHNGGAVHFGNDGKLYVAVGDNATGSNAQTLSNRLGKILRINADGGIPPDNPFVGQATGDNLAIWALGLRNPFTFSFDRTTGRMLINDVGQNTWEEVNDGIAGANFGWPTTEGATINQNCFDQMGRCGATWYFRPPLYAYPHAAGPFAGCAITGSAFYSGNSAYPNEYDGDYFFADFCGGWINRLDPSDLFGLPRPLTLLDTASVVTFASGISAPVDLAIGPEGSLYYLARGFGSATGIVARIDYTGPQAPVLTEHPAHQVVIPGQRATFSVTATSSASLSYQWQRNGTSIGGATSSIYTLPQAAPTDQGSEFRCVVSNAQGNVISNPALLTVSNGPPSAEIATPALGSRYIAGTLLKYSGAGIDPENGAVDGSRLTWQITRRVGDREQMMLGPTPGQTGSFVIPNRGETSAEMFYRVFLTVTDADGLQTSTFRDVKPWTSVVTLSTSASSLALMLDGERVVAPHTFRAVVGMLHTIRAPAVQKSNGTTREFRSWSDGGDMRHTIVVPMQRTTLVATYRRSNARMH
jgi:hypothetical protein